MKPLVLCYHAIAERDPHRMAIELDTLRNHLRLLLLRRYRPVAAGGVLVGSRRTFHVTFDDAFRSITLALPLLQDLQVPATVFVCSSYARDGRALAVPELRADVAADPHGFETLDWSALRELGGRGHEIGAHTVSHPHLPELGDAELERELVDARIEIESELGRPCRYLAYPYGDEDERVRLAARRAGYEAAFGLNPGRGRLERYALPRVDLYRRHTPLRFWALTSRVRRRATFGA